MAKTAKPSRPPARQASPSPKAAAAPAAKGAGKSPEGKSPGKAPAKQPAPKASTKAPEKAPAKPASKSPAPKSKDPAKAAGTKAAPPAKSPAKAPKPVAPAPAASSKDSSPSKGASKGSAKNTAKVATKEAAPEKGAKALAPTKPSKSAKGAAPTAGATKAEKTAASAKSAGTGEKSKKSSSKRGPIDLSTAKSVAAVAAASQADSSGYVVINGRRVRMISTKGLPAPKRAKVVAEKEVEKPEIQISSIKTKLTKKELDDYRSLLLAKRRQIIGTISGLEDEALRSSGGNLSNMPLHMADIGTDTFDQDFTLGMAQTERQTLGEIDAALQRIENKTFGVCQLTGKPIPKARLEAKPWAKFSIEAAKLVERGMAPR